MRRNAIDFGAQPLRFSGEVNLIRRDVRAGAMSEELSQFLVLPPRFDDVVIGDDFPIVPHEKTCAEDVNPEMRPRAVLDELRHSFVVDQRLARSEKFDGNVQQQTLEP
jgi:hypothetical protein